MIKEPKQKPLSRRNTFAMSASVASVAVTGWAANAASDMTIAHLPVVDPTRHTPENLSQALVRELQMMEKSKMLVQGNSEGQLIGYEGHTYKCISIMDDPKTNARGFALLEVTPEAGNSKNSTQNPAGHELLLLFPGRTQTQASDNTATAIIEGKRSPQSAVTAEYMQREVLPYLREHPEVSVSILGHSMGAGNALLAKYMADGVSRYVKTTLFEPFGAGLEASYIARDIQRAIPDANAVEDAVNQLRRNVTSIRVNPRTLISKLRVGESLTGNKQFGDNVFVLNTNPSAPLTRTPDVVSPKKGTLAGTVAAGVVLVNRSASTKPFSRRTFFKAAGTLAVPAAGAGAGVAVSELFNETYHTIVPCTTLLKTVGNGCLIPGKVTAILATNDEVLHPEHYPTSRIDSFAERVSEVYMGLTPS